MLLTSKSVYIHVVRYYDLCEYFSYATIVKADVYQIPRLWIHVNNVITAYGKNGNKKKPIS